VNIAIVILAAGQGKRMKSDLPKVLQPLAGKPLLKHVIDTAVTLDPSSLHVVYGHGGDRVREALADAPVTSWVLQAEQLGTGHAVQQALPSLRDDEIALVLYGDVPLVRSETLSRLLSLASPESMGLLTVMLEDPTGYGRVLRDTTGRVLGIVEQKDATAEQRNIREGNTGVMAIPVKHLRGWLGRLRNANAQGEYYLTDIIAMAVTDGVKVTPLLASSVAEVLGVNDKLQLAELEAENRKTRARDLMLAGVTLVDPSRIDVRGTLVTGRDVFIDVNAVFEGKVTLGDRVHVGPFARLRPGAKLSNDVHIGNFVEVKNSSMDSGAKANHLAYVGDATVGARVNIGAGTIIANYDGANKHQTVIGADAHTGSNSVLVAPITVGEGATVGAGSTVTKTVPAGKLTVARAKQVTLEGWKRPQKKR
jgi:bifunctional UDP-N-acetylglucosamine pyrophosphorylase/glucosamine-1-phosphate N-acetyltransferase